MYSFPNLETICCSMSGSNCCFLISQEPGKVSIPISLRIFHSLLLSTQSEALVQSIKQMFSWNSFAFSMIQRMLAIWSLVPWPLLNLAWTSGSSQFTYCWSFTWRILSITLLALWDEGNCAVVWTYFLIAFLWDWNENWPFTSFLTTRWQSRRMGARLFLQELQNCNSVLNSHWQENVGPHQKKIPHVQEERRSPNKTVGGAKSRLISPHIHQRRLKGSNKTLSAPGPRGPSETE